MNLCRSARCAVAVLSVTMLWAAAPAAVAEPVSNGVGYTVVPALLAAESPGGLGHWTVEYEKVAGGDPVVADAINRILDDEAHGQVWLYAASASKTSPWTFHTRGRLVFRPVTISALFTGVYDAVDLPNMPVDAVATRVFDARSGIQIVWSNLFVDERAGLARLAELTRADPARHLSDAAAGWLGRVRHRDGADTAQLPVLDPDRRRDRTPFPGPAVRPGAARHHGAVGGRRRSDRTGVRGDHQLNTSSGSPGLQPECSRMVLDTTCRHGSRFQVPTLPGLVNVADCQ